MTHSVRISALATAFGLGLVLMAGPAMAACYVDYKAKMDNPLRLHYGVIQVSDNVCNASGGAAISTAFSEIAPRVAGGGWELLEVMTVFDDSGLDARRADAGQFYLAF